MHNSSSYQEYVHQYKKVKVNSDSKQNMGNIDFFQHNDFDDCHSSVQTGNQLSPLFNSILLNQQSEFNNRIDNTIPCKTSKCDNFKIICTYNFFVVRRVAFYIFLE